MPKLPASTLDRIRHLDPGANIEPTHASWRPDPRQPILSKLHQLKLDDDDDDDDEAEEVEIAVPRLPMRPSQLKSPWDTTTSMDNASSGSGNELDPSDETVNHSLDVKIVPKKKCVELLSSAQYVPHNHHSKKPKNLLNLASLAISGYPASLRNLTGNQLFMNTSTRAASDDLMDGPETPRPDAGAPLYPELKTPTQSDANPHYTAQEAEV